MFGYCVEPNRFSFPSFPPPFLFNIPESDTSSRESSKEIARIRSIDKHFRVAIQILFTRASEMERVSKIKIRNSLVFDRKNLPFNPLPLIYPRRLIQTLARKVKARAELSKTRRSIHQRACREKLTAFSTARSITRPSIRWMTTNLLKNDPPRARQKNESHRRENGQLNFFTTRTQVE